MSRATPLVSVVIPTKDRAALLSEALASLRAQSLSRWEAIVVDDGSRDGTRAELERWTERDPRIRAATARAGRQGGNHCRNVGLGLARAELVCFLDDDDQLSPACLEARVTVCELWPELDYAVFPRRIFLRAPGDTDRTLSATPARDALESFLEVLPPWQTGGVVWRKTALQRLRGWDERLSYFQDWELHVRALARGLRYRVEDGPYFFFREWPSGGQSVTGRGRSPAHARSVALAVETGLTAIGAGCGFTRRRRRRALRLGSSSLRQLLELGLREEALAHAAALAGALPWSPISHLLLSHAGAWVGCPAQRGALSLLRRC